MKHTVSDAWLIMVNELTSTMVKMNIMIRGENREIVYHLLWWDISRGFLVDCHFEN